MPLFVCWGSLKAETPSSTQHGLPFDPSSGELHFCLLSPLATFGRDYSLLDADAAMILLHNLLHKNLRHLL